MVNKAQMKIQQMIFMLLAVTLFFAIAGMFILVINFSNLRGLAENLDEKNAMLLVSKLANSPEFSCGEAFGSKRSGCVDADKLMALKNNIEKYKDFWGVSNIEIRKIYPKSDEEKNCVGRTYPNCNIIRLVNEDVSGFSVSNFVSLCRKEYSEKGEYDKCELAKLIVSYGGDDEE